MLLHLAFIRADPKFLKRQSSQQCRFELLGLTSIKAGRKMLMKSTQAIDFTNILRAPFFAEKNTNTNCK